MTGISAVLKMPIRSEMLARRKQLAPDICVRWSSQIQKAFLGLPEFLLADCLALYSPIRNEVFTEGVFREALGKGKTTAYPRVRQGGLEFIKVTDLKDMVAGAFGIPEPVGSVNIPVSALDLLVVPGVAFDMAGHRLGYGKGYYDRALRDPRKRCILIGFGFEQQLIELLPVEAHDIRMDLLVTERRTLRFGGARQALQNFHHGGGPGL